MVYCPHCGKGKGTTSMGTIILLQHGGKITCNYCGKRIELKEQYMESMEHE